MPDMIPSTSRVTLFAATLAEPLAILATWATGLLILAFGVMKLIPHDSTTEPASAQLLRISTGGIIDAQWGIYLVGGIQVALGLGLLTQATRPVTGLACVFFAVVIAIGGISHWTALTNGSPVHPSGIALITLFVLMLAGAALGSRSAAKRMGVTN